MVTLYVVVLCIVLHLGSTPDPKIITCYGNYLGNALLHDTAFLFVA